MRNFAAGLAIGVALIVFVAPLGLALLWASRRDREVG